MDESNAAGQPRWVCKVCGYVYDPALNDGVAFADLPDQWRCPGCGFGKAVFRKLNNTKSLDDAKGLEQ